MSSSRPLVRLEDILDNAERIRRYSNGFDRDTLERSDMAYDAVERCLGRISEAATKLGSWAEDEAPDYPWKALRSLGNILRHDYDGILRDRVIDMVVTDLPGLVVVVQGILERNAPASLLTRTPPSSPR